MALVMRLSIPESVEFKKLQRQGELSVTPVGSMLKKQRKPLFFTISLSTYGNIAYYLVLSYLETHCIDLGYTQFFSLSVIVFFSLVFSFSAPLWGIISDSIGRKPLIKLAVFIYIFCSYPAFMLMDMGTTYLIISITVLIIPLMAIWGSYGAGAPELCKAKYRYSGNALSYNIGNSFFGGTIPFIATLMIVIFGGVTAPSCLLIISSIIMIPILYYMPETRSKEI